MIFDEGDMSKNARLLLSVPADEESNVPISIEGDEGSVINFTSNVNIRPNTAYGVRKFVQYLLIAYNTGDLACVQCQLASTFHNSLFNFHKFSDLSLLSSTLSS